MQYKNSIKYVGLPIMRRGFLMLQKMDANADPNVCDQEHNSPLIEASENGHVQIVRKLLDKKADINKKTSIADRTALFYACTFGKEDVFTVILDLTGCKGRCL